MTLRARLTIWYSSLLAGILILFGTIVYLMLSYTMTVQVQDLLLNTAEDIRSASMRTVRGIEIDELAFNLTANVYVQLWDTNGELKNPNTASMKEPFDPELLGSEAATYSRVTIENSTFSVLTYPLIIQPEDQLIGYLQLAISLETVNRALENLLFLMALGVLIAVALAAVVGWSTAGTALRPLDRMTEAALQITRADDLSKRISMRGPPRDEVGKLSAAFNETLERLEGLFVTQRRFIADVSHELRTPLTAIRGNVDLIRRMGEADDESLEAITSEVDRMTRMVQDLLLLAQAETGKLTLAQDEIELDTLMLEVYKQTKVIAKEKLDIQIGQEDQVRIVGDRDRLKQVLLNLVANAIEHTPEDGIITLGLKKVGQWARLTVTDTGSGIPNEALPHIFERFYKMDPSRSRNSSGGTGLGLSIAYWITRSHGGRIEVASDEKWGTTFSVWLPVLEAEEPTNS